MSNSTNTQEAEILESTVINKSKREEYTEKLNALQEESSKIKQDLWQKETEILIEGYEKENIEHKIKFYESQVEFYTEVYNFLDKIYWGPETFKSYVIEDIFRIIDEYIENMGNDSNYVPKIKYSKLDQLFNIVSLSNGIGRDMLKQKLNLLYPLSMTHEKMKEEFINLDKEVEGKVSELVEEYAEYLTDLREESEETSKS